MNKLIALFALAAVLLAAFEHEDLIFQSPALAPATGFAQTGARDAFSVAVEDRAESGTEGTFRSETHRFWLSPKQETRVAWMQPRPSALISSAGLASYPQPDLRPRLAGIVALRL